ncbi:hypothetical protein [Bradyrhizobium cenepequi]|uniref:hypothetical protein n=1 Tax=Bradyrhizobium cenepequi TaxID=2821403 RepID=UPI001CE26C18|nr:hypothetical protein [Bradyrhizobium cenepequi]MCA6112599.1 hypothetical protein [Bradyrhizobium cenepequi]
MLNLSLGIGVYRFGQIAAKFPEKLEPIGKLNRNPIAVPIAKGTCMQAIWFDFVSTFVEDTLRCCRSPQLITNRTFTTLALGKRAKRGKRAFQNLAENSRLARKRLTPSISPSYAPSICCPDNFLVIRRRVNAAAARQTTIERAVRIVPIAAKTGAFSHLMLEYILTGNVIVLGPRNEPGDHNFVE